jgi:hypothetical protein
VLQYNYCPLIIKIPPFHKREPPDGSSSRHIQYTGMVTGETGREETRGVLLKENVINESISGSDWI